MSIRQYDIDYVLRSCGNGPITVLVGIKADPEALRYCETRQEAEKLVRSLLESSTPCIAWATQTGDVHEGRN